MNELFNNKTIAVIGNAKSLFDKSYGKEIDSHDIVIRINKGIEVCTREKDFLTHGSKTDLWCFNLYNKRIESFDDEMKKILLQTYKRMQMNVSPVSKNYDFSISYEVLKEIQNIFEYREHKHVTTGLRVLHCISKYNFRSVDVYGFDWKETPTFYNLREDNRQHDYIKEKDYCFKHYFNNGKFNLKN